MIGLFGWSKQAKRRGYAVEFFTNAEKTKEEEVDVTAPAFSITKVQTSFGALIGVALAAVPAALKEDPAVVIASIAAGAFVILGIMALAAVDIMTRQRAHEAELRFGSSKTEAADFVALPESDDDLVLQVGHNKDEYEVKLATVKDGEVTLVATRDGQSISQTFQEPPKPK